MIEHGKNPVGLSGDSVDLDSEEEVARRAAVLSTYSFSNMFGTHPVTPARIQELDKLADNITAQYDSTHSYTHAPPCTLRPAM